MTRIEFLNLRYQDARYNFYHADNKADHEMYSVMMQDINKELADERIKQLTAKKEA